MIHLNSWDADLFGQPVRNCMTYIVGKDASPTGKVLVGHNEDDSGSVKAYHGHVPAADWPEGTTLPAELGCAAVNQVKHTYAYHWSEFRGPKGGLSNADAFVNEKGVCITSNSCSMSRQDTEDASRVTDGGVAYNLRRILAERAGSAREGLQILIDMVETWGYAPSGRAYTVADANEAYMMQIVSGKHYVAARVPDDMIAVMPNHYTFHQLDEFEGMIHSKNLVEYAIEKGWYIPAVEGSFDDFDFARAYQAEDTWMQSYNVLRHVHSMEKLGVNWADERLPFAVKARAGVEELIALLSNHYEGTPDDDRLGSGRSPHDTGNCRVCSSSTVESFVCVLDEIPELITLWTSFGRPCQQPFVPLHPAWGLPQNLQPMTDPAGSMARHLLPDLPAAAWRDAPTQRLHDFGNRMEMVYSDARETVSEGKKALHETYARNNDALVENVRGLLSSGKREEGLQALREFDEAAFQQALDAVDAWEKTFNRVNVLAASRETLVRGENIALTVEGAFPAEEDLILGVCRARNHDQYAKAVPGSLHKLTETSWTAAFSCDPLLDQAESGRHECYLGGRDETGKAFYGELFVEI